MYPAAEVAISRHLATPGHSVGKLTPVPIQQPRTACTGSGIGTNSGFLFIFRQCDKELSRNTLEIKQVPLVSLVVLLEIVLRVVCQCSSFIINILDSEIDVGQGINLGP